MNRQLARRRPAGRGWYARFAAAVALVLAVSALTAVPASGNLPTAVVTLGDSYISGEAGRWQGNSNTWSGDRRGTDRAARSTWYGWSYDKARVYLEGTAANGCHRSDVAQVRSTSFAVDARLDLACSGAETRHLLPAAAGGQSFKGEAPQIDRLAAIAGGHRVRMVVVSVGGNDLGFSDIIVDCAASWSSSSSSNKDLCRDRQQARVDAALPGVVAQVGRVLDELRQVLTAAGSGDARVVLQSYPSPIPRAAENRYPETGWSRLDTGGCPFWDEDSDWARDALVPQLSAALRGVATDRGVEFLDLQDALQGREVCSTATSLVTTSPSETASEWVRFLVSGYVQGDRQESFHPNAYAQRALGRCTDLLWAAGPGHHRCTNRAGQGVSGMRLSRLG